MFSYTELFISFRYLKSRKRENIVSLVSGFSFLGITLGVATLIVVLAVMDGFRGELFKRVLGINPHIVITSKNGPIYNYLNLKDQISLVSGIENVFPIIDSQVMVRSKSQVAGSLIRGMTLSDIKQVDILKSNLITGNFDSLYENQIIIGNRLANILDVGLGDKVTIFSSSSTSTVIGSIPRSKSYKIGGIFNIGMYEYDSTYIFLNLKEAMNFFNYSNSVGYMDLRLANPDDVVNVTNSLLNILTNDYNLLDWKQLNSSYVNALEVERNVMFLILTLIILVAAFNIISGLVMLVKEKNRDIAVLRTMGASKYSIMRIFFISGITIGLSGTFFGALIGILFASNISSIQLFLDNLTGSNLFAAEIYFLSQLPANIIFSDILKVTSMSIFLSILATLYPSWKASRMEPIEALRYE